MFYNLGFSSQLYLISALGVWNQKGVTQGGKLDEGIKTQKNMKAEKQKWNALWRRDESLELKRGQEGKDNAIVYLPPSTLFNLLSCLIFMAI